MTGATKQIPADTELVNISPGVSVLSLFRHLNYKAWYALAELVDNALQSSLTNLKTLRDLHGSDYKCIVQIEYDPSGGGRITVRDNAAGINTSDYQRAFKTAQPPLDRSGLSQFGVGMKSAACWFARRWTVRTSALGEDIERYIEFDVTSIVSNGTDRLAPKITPAPRKAHFTEIQLIGLHNLLLGGTVGKIRTHLGSIYRIFQDDDLLEIRFNGEALWYQEPRILEAAFFKTPDEPKITWSKDILIDLGDGRKIAGFAGLRETASTAGAGFALFNRKRLIQGSADDGYRPELIFGRSNSFTYQRLFGELHLTGFEVTHTKDGFRWDGDEDEMLLKLKASLNAPPMPLLDQAEGHRVRPPAPDLTQAGSKALQATAAVIEREVIPLLDKQMQALGPAAEPSTVLPAASQLQNRTFDVTLADNPWRIVLELTTDASVGPWLSVAEQPAPKGSSIGTPKLVCARVSLAHPFMDRFSGADPERIEPLLRVAAALMLAEVSAREAGIGGASTIRENVNELLRYALSKPA